MCFVADFANLIVWQEAAKLAAAVLSATDRLTGRLRSHVADQMIRAADSIPANIAEGVGRGVSRDCLRFLRIARASGQELESHLKQAWISGRLQESDARALVSHAHRVRYLLRRFQESVERRLNGGT